MSDYVKAIKKLMEARTPLERKVCMAAMVRAMVSDLEATVGRENDTIQTFEEAGLATSEDGVVLRDPYMGMEFKFTIGSGPELTFGVDVSAIREGSEPFVPLVRMVLEGAMREAGIGPIPKDE